MRNLKLSFIFLFFSGCEPFVSEFSDSSEPLLFKASFIENNSNAYQGGSIKVVTWNMRFGIGRFPFFGDSCGEGVIADEETVSHTMQAIADSLNTINADIVLLQEVDIESKRSGYWNQIQYLLDNTYLNYGAYASMWQAQVTTRTTLGVIVAILT